MVKKGSKRGLNTGNTIRQCSSSSALHQHQKYGCLVVNSNISKKAVAAGNSVSDVSTYIPHDTFNEVEYSLNKRQRWDLPEYLKHKVEYEHDNPDTKITLMEHTMNPAMNVTNGSWDTCDAYYCNTGSVRERVSNSEMSLTSAKQGYRAEDHLTKAERRKLKKLKRKDNPEEDAETDNLPSYECHVVYGAPTNGKLHKNMATKGFAKSNKKGQSVTTGCSKRFLHRHAYTDDELSLYTDDDIYGVETDDYTTSRPITASLADLLVTSSNQNERRARKCSTTSTDSFTSSEDKSWIIYLDEPAYPGIPTKPAHRSKAPASAPIQYNPQYSTVLIKPSDVDMATLVLNFGDKYREAYSTPRTITLDFSDDLRATAKNERLYLVMVLRAEGKDFHHYRVYCTGSHIDMESTKIGAIKDGDVYDLLTLKSVVLLSVGQRPAERQLTSRPTTKYIQTTNGKQRGYAGARWNVTSSDLSALAQQTVNKHHKQMYQVSTRDIVFIPTQLQRSMSCTLHCGICFEELNDSVLHSALLSCNHYFCNECWSAHVSNAVREGLVHITCPEYECKREVDIVFLMSMLDFSTYSLHEVHLTEYSLFSQKKAIWCPSKGCERVLHCDDELAIRDDPITASCKCGSECCFKCLKEPHWPLTCDQLTSYHELLRKQGFAVLINPKSLPCITVNTRPCPKCSIHIEKAGGCQWMWCSKCRTSFCWNCGFVARYGYPHVCNTKNYKSMSTRFVYERHDYDTSNHYVGEACKHRIYKAKQRRTELNNMCKQLLASSNVRHKLVLECEFKTQSVRRYLHQIVEQIVTTHNLLEYCCAVNVFKKGSKYCVPTISLLSYSVGVLERVLSSNRCNQYTVDKLVKYYGIVKSNTHLLVRNISLALSLVKPVVGVESDK